MPRLSRYLSVSPTHERKYFDSVSEAVEYFTSMGYKVCEFDSHEKANGEVTKVLTSTKHPRDYVEITKQKSSGVNAIRYRD